MKKPIHRNLLNNINRGLIFSFTSIGLLMDGYQFADLMCVLALVVWLWLRLFTRMEMKLLCWIDGNNSRPDRYEPVLPCNPSNHVNSRSQN